MDEIDLTEQWGYWVWCPSEGALKETLCRLIDHMEQYIPPEYRKYVQIIHTRGLPDVVEPEKARKPSVGWKYTPPDSRGLHEGVAPPEAVLSQL